MNTETVKKTITSDSFRKKIKYGGITVMFAFASWLITTVYDGAVTIIEKGDAIVKVHEKLTNSIVNPKFDKMQDDYTSKIDTLRGEIGLRTAQAKDYHDVDTIAQNRARDREIDKMEERMNQRFDKVDITQAAILKEVRTLKLGQRP